MRTLCGHRLLSVGARGGLGIFGIFPVRTECGRRVVANKAKRSPDLFLYFARVSRIYLPLE